MSRTSTKKAGFKKVLENISKLYDEDTKEGKKYWHEAFDKMIDELCQEDFFGTESQCDPRGDQRD